MITMHSYINQNMDMTLRDIGRNDSMLIIGSGKNEQKLHEVYRPLNSYDMENTYGECELTTAYNDAIMSGAQNVFVLNAFKTTDFIECTEYIKSLNFMYIVPIGFKISDMFYSAEYGRDMYFTEYYINKLSQLSNSLIIVTDEHAELYEYIDDYLNDMHTKISDFKEHSLYILENKGHNLLFCLNNISDFKYSNVVLGAKLSSSIPGQYPDTTNSSAVFDLDSEDIYEREIIYFKNNHITRTSIENLNNFRVTSDANKVVTIDLVIKYIERTLDLSFLVGKLYNNYIKITIKDYLDNYMRKLIGITIRSYTINNIDFLVDRKSISGYFVIHLDVYPINSIEVIEAVLEVG